MRSIHTIKSGDQGKKDYYTKDESLKRGKGRGKDQGNSNDPKAYYSQGEGESESEEMTQAVWFGKDAERLNLRGHGYQADFEQIFDGYIPGTNQRIRFDKPREDHQENCIYDVVLTCKKSVSMQIHLGQDERLYKAYQKTVKEIAELIERDYAQARIQVNGDRRIVQTGGIIAMMIPHHTSRDGDMNVHTHLAIANGTYCEDGKWRSLLDRGFSHAYYMGDYFSARLAARVQELGYEIRETVTQEGHPSWELAGYSDEQIKVFSKRSENAKVKALVEAGMSRDEALLRTRKAKDTEESLEQAQARWSKEAEDHEIEAIIPFTQPVEPLRRVSAQQVLESAIRHYSHRSNHFTRDQIREYAFKLNHTFTVADLDQAIAAHPSLIDYGKLRTVDELRGHFTTVEAVEREIRTIQAWMMGQGQATPILNPDAAAQLLDKVPLKTGQRSAILGVVTSENQHQIIHGLSGVGKTTALRQLKTLSDRQMVEVIGLAPSIGAAKRLSDELGIETYTVQKLVKSKRFELKPNQLVIIDEAGMVSAQMLDVILQKANAARARVLLVGDTGQNQAIEAGSPMRSLMKHGAEVHHISEIIRQQNTIQKQAVSLIAQGDGLDALSLLNEHGYIHPITERESRVRAIATEFLSLSPEEQNNTLIVAGTNAEKDAIASVIRAGLKEEGRLGESRTVIQLRDRSLTPEEAKEVAFYRVGDYVSLTRDYKSSNLHKDTPYQVMGKVEGELVVASPGGRLYRLDPKQFKDKQVFSSREFDVAVGDSLRWTSSNRNRGQINGKTFKITALDGQLATILTDDGLTQVDLSQPLPLDYTLTSTSYRVQGSDRPRVFVSATNDPTSNREPFYVSISRQIKDLKIWTEDYDALALRVAESSVQRNPLELLDYARHNTTRNPVHSDDRNAADSGAVDRTAINVGDAARRNPANPRPDAGANQGTPQAQRGQEPDLAGRRTPGGNADRTGRSPQSHASKARPSDRTPQLPDLYARRTAELQEIADALYRIRIQRELAAPLARLQSALADLQDQKQRIQEKEAQLAQQQAAFTEKLQEYLLTQTQTEVVDTTLKEWRSLREDADLVAVSEESVAIAEWNTLSDLIENFPAQKAMAIAATEYHQASAPIIDAINGEIMATPKTTEPPTQRATSPPGKPQKRPSRNASGNPKKRASTVFWQPLYRAKAPSHIEPNHWAEFKRSAIHPELIALNAESVSGQEVYERLLSERLAQLGSGQYVTQPMARLMAQYEQVADGGWWGKAGIEAQSLLNLKPGDQPQLSTWGCFKADHPRIDSTKSDRSGETQFIKYENPLGVSRSLYLPIVPDKLAERIYEKHGISPTEAEKQSGFWFVVHRHNVPITITEGAKKTWASLSQGEVTIGVSGVNGLYRANDPDGNPLPTRQLNEDIAVFATPGREFRFAYDQDKKASTIRNVRRDLVRGIELLEANGCTCKVAKWNPDDGKGLDDLISNRGPLTYTKAIALAESSARAKRTHYRTQYNAIARQVRVNYPDPSPELLDAEVYLRTIAKAELADGDRFISQSDQVRAIKDPGQVQNYIDFIKTNALKIRQQQQQREANRGQYQAIAQQVTDELGQLPSHRLDMEVCLRVQAKGAEPDTILAQSDTALTLDDPSQVQDYIDQIKSDAPQYHQLARDRAEYLSIAKFARRTMGDFPDDQIDLYVCVSVGIDGAEADRVLAQSDTALALNDPNQVNAYIEHVKAQIPIYHQEQKAQQAQTARAQYEAIAQELRPTLGDIHELRLDAHVYRTAVASGNYTPDQIDAILSQSNLARALKSPDEVRDHIQEVKRIESRPKFGRHRTSERAIAMSQQNDRNKQAIAPCKWLAKYQGEFNVKDGSYSLQLQGYSFTLKGDHLTVTRKEEVILDSNDAVLNGSVSTKEIETFQKIANIQKEHLAKQREQQLQQSRKRSQYRKHHRR